jgi:hypothetical protein
MREEMRQIFFDMGYVFFHFRIFQPWFDWTSAPSNAIALHVLPTRLSPGLTPGLGLIGRFTEMATSRFVESAFWNFDSMFVPQQHPAREVQDTFYVKSESFSPSSLLFVPDKTRRGRRERGKRARKETYLQTHQKQVDQTKNIINE